jgi:drug/metabolite transporter (DMT)-like permease
MKGSHERQGWVHVLLVLITLSWGFNNIVMKIGFEFLTPQQFGGVRMLMAFPFMVYLAGFMPGRVKFTRKDFFSIAGIGLIGMGVFQILFHMGIDETSPSIGGILMATMPVQVVILSILFRMEKPGWRSILGVLLTIAGLAVITLSTKKGGEGLTTIRGILFVVLAELGYSVHTTFLRPFMKRYSTLQVTGLAMSVAVIEYLLIFQTDLRALDLKAVPIVGYLSAAYSGLIGLFVANVLWNIAVKRIGSTKVAVYGNLPTVFVLILSALIFGDLLHMRQLLGALIILAGVLLVQLRTKPLVPTPDAPVSQPQST